MLRVLINAVHKDAAHKRHLVVACTGWIAAGLLGAALLVPLSGCGGGSSANPSVGVSISPAATALAAGGTQTFIATVTGTTLTSVTWSVEEGTTGGTITSAGVYTAPAAAGTYHVIATSTADSTKTAAAAVTVSASTASAIGVSISPATTALAINGTQTFTATVTNATDTSVTWSVEEGASGGTVTAAGVYTAPATAGTYHVIATSTADSTKTATATVTVTIQSGGSTVTVS